MAAVRFQSPRWRSSRTRSVGPFAQFNVNFGVSSGGSMTASVEPMVMRQAA